MKAHILFTCWLARRIGFVSYTDPRPMINRLLAVGTVCAALGLAQDARPILSEDCLRGSNQPAVRAGGTGRRAGRGRAGRAGRSRGRLWPPPGYRPDPGLPVPLRGRPRHLSGRAGARRAGCPHRPARCRGKRLLDMGSEERALLKRKCRVPTTLRACTPRPSNATCPGGSRENRWRPESRPLCPRTRPFSSFGSPTCRRSSPSPSPGNASIGGDRLEEAMLKPAIGAEYTDLAFQHLLDLNVRPLYEEFGKLSVSFPNWWPLRTAGR